jgi:hypothetical protein
MCSKALGWFFLKARLIRCNQFLSVAVVKERCAGLSTAPHGKSTMGYAGGQDGKRNVYRNLKFSRKSV